MFKAFGQSSAPAEQSTEFSESTPGGKTVTRRQVLGFMAALPLSAAGAGVARAFPGNPDLEEEILRQKQSPAIPNVPSAINAARKEGAPIPELMEYRSRPLHPSAISLDTSGITAGWLNNPDSSGNCRIVISPDPFQGESQDISPVISRTDALSLPSLVRKGALPRFVFSSNYQSGETSETPDKRLLLTTSLKQNGSMAGLYLDPCGTDPKHVHVIESPDPSILDTTQRVILSSRFLQYPAGEPGEGVELPYITIAVPRIESASNGEDGEQDGAQEYEEEIPNIGIESRVPAEFCVTSDQSAQYGTVREKVRRIEPQTTALTSASMPNKSWFGPGEKVIINPETNPIHTNPDIEPESLSESIIPDDERNNFYAAHPLENFGTNPKDIRAEGHGNFSGVCVTDSKGIPLTVRFRFTGNGVVYHGGEYASLPLYVLLDGYQLDGSVDVKASSTQPGVIHYAYNTDQRTIFVTTISETSKGTQISDRIVTRDATPGSIVRMGEIGGNLYAVVAQEGIVQIYDLSKDESERSQPFQLNGNVIEMEVINRDRKLYVRAIVEGEEPINKNKTRELVEFLVGDESLPEDLDDKRQRLPFIILAGGRPPQDNQMSMMA